MKKFCLLLSFIFIQGCEFMPPSKLNIGDYVTTNLDHQIGRVDDMRCNEIAFTEEQKNHPCKYYVTFPLKNGGFDSFWFEGLTLKKAEAPFIR